MASDFVEYEFTLPDGSKRHEFVERCDAYSQMMRFKRMHGAVSAVPLALSAETVDERAARYRRIVAVIEEHRRNRRPPQNFDTSALPLFGDQRRQLDLL